MGYPCRKHRKIAKSENLYRLFTNDTNRRLQPPVRAVFTIKADAFIVFERAKSSPLTRQPDFMHM